MNTQIDLEQFRLPVEAWKSRLDPNDDDESEAYDEADRLLALIDNAGKAECPHDAWEENGGARRCADCRKYLGAAAPMTGDARMALALEWARDVAQGMPASAAKEHLPAIEEAIAAYNPSCGARTVRVVDGEVRFNAAFFVNNAGNRIEQLTTYEDYRRDGAVLALMDLGQKRASAKKLTKKGGGQVVLAWVSAPQPILEDDGSPFARAQGV